MEARRPITSLSTAAPASMQAAAAQNGRPRRCPPPAKRTQERESEIPSQQNKERGVCRVHLRRQITISNQNSSNETRPTIARSAEAGASLASSP